MSARATRLHGAVDTDQPHGAREKRARGTTSVSEESVGEDVARCGGGAVALSGWD
ncbi:hypothetical protein [Haladaptatus sp. R4]|uniref:hypothetical protein n=1 Tax=Haladaptatus sp. R4 TaxID=1679489 RepID=UPI001681BDB4|nr:hypothetical protein [Haladaptatus sp. R4]